MSILKLNLLFPLALAVFAWGVESKPEGRIIDGSTVDVTRHPYFASLRIRRNKESPYLHECGAAIYSANAVITAAQCVSTLAADVKMVVVVGANTRNGTDGLVYPVASWTYHPKFSVFTADYDIALVVLESAFNLQNFGIRTIGLRPERPAPGRNALVIGWGYRQEWGPSSYHLEQVHVPIVSLDQCNQVYGANEVTERMICAGDVQQGGRDACHGDTGGPLIIDEQLVGLVSWGRGCGRVGYPTVYTYVPSLKSWIDETLNAAKAP